MTESALNNLAPANTDPREFTNPRSLSGVLLLAVDLLLAALVFVLPFIMGGREALGHWFLITASLALGLSWTAFATVSGQKLRLTGLELLFAAGLLLVWFQTQPQSQATLTSLSSEYSRLLSAWSDTQTTVLSDQPAVWSTPSLTPAETRHAWWVLLAYSLVYIVAIQRIRRIEDCSRVLRWICMASFAMTGFAIIQLVLTNGKYFWFYRNPYTGTDQLLKGAFTNRNHFAHFLVMSIGPIMWWLASTQTDGNQNQRVRRSTSDPIALTMGSGRSSSFSSVLNSRFLGLLTALSIVSFCILLSLSRGGMVSAAVAFIVAAVGLSRSLKLNNSLPVILCGGGMLLLGLMAVFGQDQIQVRLDQLVSADADNIDHNSVRRKIWAADWSAFQAFPILGTGIGSHAEVYPTYMSNLADFPSTRFTHTENCYLQIAMESGSLGFGLVVFGIVLIIGRLVSGFRQTKSSTRKACIVAIAAALSANLLHSAGDFLWYVPTIVVTGLILLAVGLTAAQHNSVSSGIVIPRFGWACCAGLCLMALIQTQPRLLARADAERHWYAYLTEVFDERRALQEEQNQFEQLNDELTEESEVSAVEQDAFAAEADEFAEYSTAETAPAETAPADTEQSEVAVLRNRISLLMAAIRSNPDHLAARSALSSRILELFELTQQQSDNPLALDQIRSAAVSAQFESTNELHDWLKTAFGKRITLTLMADRISRESLKLCPISGPSYQTILETNFLQDASNSKHDSLIDQLITLRGFDPKIRFVLGRERLLEGNLDDALEHWRIVFHASETHRRGIINLLAAQVPAQFFVTAFEPSAMELQDILTAYDTVGRTQDSYIVLQQLCNVIPAESASIEDPDERLNLMLVAYESSQRLQNSELSESLLRSMAAEFPSAYKPRYFLALLLMEQEQERLKNR